jgi:hypothetical protein
MSAFQEAVDAHIGRGAIDVRAPAAGIAEAVADGVLDAKRGEVEALQRAPDRGEVHAQAALDPEQRGPVHLARRRVDAGLIGILELAHPPKHARSEARLQVGAIAGFPGAGEPDASCRRRDRVRAQRRQLRGEQRLEAARARREKRFRTV